MEKFFSDDQERRRLQMVQDDVEPTTPATARTPVPVHAPRFHRRIRL